MKMTGSYFRPMGANLLKVSRDMHRKNTENLEKITDCCIAKNSSLSNVTLSNKPCTKSKALLQIFCASRMLRINIVVPH